MRIRLSPATVISAAALFFALGGTALAVSHAVRPQARCANGAVRAFAVVTGAPGKGLANIPDQFSNSGAYFLSKFNCAGGAVPVRRVDTALYEIHFAGNPSVTAVATGSGANAYLQVLAPGTFRVGLNVPGREDKAEVPFIVAAF